MVPPACVPGLLTHLDTREESHVIPQFLMSAIYCPGLLSFPCNCSIFSWREKMWQEGKTKQRPMTLLLHIFLLLLKNYSFSQIFYSDSCSLLLNISPQNCTQAYGPCLTATLWDPLSPELSTGFIFLWSWCSTWWPDSSGTVIPPPNVDRTRDCTPADPGSTI